METITAIIASTWAILEDSAVFILFGFTLAGIIKVYLPMGAVKKSLGGRNFGSVAKAALIGVPLPLCSCSVIPTAVALRKAGAGKGATSAFLISTPESGVDSISLSYALLDPLMTVFRPMAAFLTAFFAGLLETLFDKDDSVVSTEQKRAEPAGCSSGCEKNAVADDGGATGRLRKIARFAFVEMMDDLAGWMMFGLVFAGVIMALVPEKFFTEYFNESYLAMPAMLFLGVPIYICASSSTPMAAVMIVKGLSPGAALVFLLAGPATNISTIMILRNFMGARSMWIYLFSIAFCSIALGLALDAIYGALAIDPAVTMGKAAEIFPKSVETTSAVIFTALAARSILKQYRRKFEHFIRPTAQKI
ncbi:Uncharacterized membrane protein, YraQ family [hydrothermal vent metagenome]|uniref:Uncharacterized membrane protein, YraQ family n=1 Tax=hydrothermal vent metagenome TaxID=652676 RepID=A0A3B1CGN0_9ZZZZ